MPPSVEICVFDPDCEEIPGRNGRTYAWFEPDSSDTYASHRPSGENVAPPFHRRRTQKRRGRAGLGIAGVSALDRRCPYILVGSRVDLFECQMGATKGRNGLHTPALHQPLPFAGAVGADPPDTQTSYRLVGEILTPGAPDGPFIGATESEPGQGSPFHVINPDIRSALLIPDQCQPFAIR